MSSRKDELIQLVRKTPEPELLKMLRSPKIFSLDDLHVIHENLCPAHCECDLEILPCKAILHPVARIPKNAIAFHPNGQGVVLATDGDGIKHHIESDQTERVIRFNGPSGAFIEIKESAEEKDGRVIGVQVSQRPRRTYYLKAGLYQVGYGIPDSKGVRGLGCECPMVGRFVPCPDHVAQPDEVISEDCEEVLLLRLFPEDYIDRPTPPDIEEHTIVTDPRAMAAIREERADAGYALWRSNDECRTGAFEWDQIQDHERRHRNRLDNGADERESSISFETHTHTGKAGAA